MALTNRDIKIRTANSTDIKVAAKIIAESFYDDPILIWIVEDPEERKKVAIDFFELYVSIGIEKGVVDLAVIPKDGIVGCAIWLPHDEQDDNIEAKLYSTVGTHASQFSLFGEIMLAHYPPVTSYWQLFAIAVLPLAHGLGVGGKLIEYRLYELDTIGMPSYLEATTRLSAGGLYRRLGYQPVGEPIKFPSGVEAFPMWRNPQELITKPKIYDTGNTNAPMVGSVVQFGNYKWRVLNVEDNKILIISENIIDIQKYHEHYETVTWADCTLRPYLNNNFYNNFSLSDQSLIIETRISNHDNHWFGTDGGEYTTDKVFLLSIEEMAKYFGDSKQLRNKNPNSKYFIDDHFNSERIALDKDGEALWYWLRTPGNISSFAAGVTSDGRISVSGDFVNRNNSFGGGIRPALWLKL